MNGRQDGRVWVRGVVQEVRRYLESRADMVVYTDDGRVVRGTMPAMLRDVAVALVGRRVTFEAHVDGQGRYHYPTRAEVVHGFMRLEVSQVRASRLARHDAATVVVVDVRTTEAGDAVLVLPVEVARALWQALAEPVVLPARNGRVR